MNILSQSDNPFFKEILGPIINSSISQNNQILFNILIELFKKTVFERNNIPEKYEYLKNVLSNPFLTESQKSEFLGIFAIIQR
jgi:hypothetical protein